MTSRKKPGRGKGDFLQALDALPAHDQEAVLLRSSARIRALGQPCPCESGQLFADCHGNVP